MRDWAGLPEHLLMKVAGKVISQTEAGWARRKETYNCSEERIQEEMAERQRDGNCPLFVFAMVCKEWRKAQLRVGGRLRTRVCSDVILPGQVELVKWALAEGCPKAGKGCNISHAAAKYGHLELVRWLCGEGGFAMDEYVMEEAAYGGNLELVKWLRGEGCPWDWETCNWAVNKGHVEVLRWAREYGCPWDARTRDEAAAKFGYTDDIGNEYGYSDEVSDED